MRTGLSDVTRVMSALVAAATIAACGGDDDDVTPPTPAISTALSSSALDITQGTNGMATVNLTRSGGFAGDVAIAVDGLPGTVTYASVPATIDGNASSAIITFDVGESATPGVINATVKATGTGVSAEMAPLAITVVAAPTYTLAVANAAVTATQGGMATQTVNITRTGGFVGAVSLTAEGLPTGVTAAFDPESAAGNSSTLTLTAAANAATGSATVTVKGTASGQADKTATFQLKVNAPASSNFTLAVNPATLTIQQGTSGTSRVTITRRGFVLGVVLTATGLPNGVTAVFSNQTYNTSTLTLTASATATTGPATVTIHGRTRQIVDRTTKLSLTVNPAAGGSSNTSLELSTVDQTPIWLAPTSVPDGALALTNYFIPSGSGAGGATVGTSGGPSKGEYRYYGVAASKQIAGDPSDSRRCHDRRSDADPRPFDRRSRHRRSSVSGRVYHSTIPRQRRSLEPLSSLEIVVRVRLFATELRAD